MLKFEFRKLLIVFAMVFLGTNCWAQSFLRTDGQNIVDESGNVFLLKGVGLGNWFLPEGYMWKFGSDGDRPRKIEKIISDYIGQEKAAEFWKKYRENYITAADIKKIAELGFNSVRPALNSRLFITEGENNEFVDEGFLLLDSLIARCKRNHLYVIIDMHGAPGGQTGQNIDDSSNDLPELFSDPKNQDLLVKLWVKIAERYKNEPTVAAYDLLNEPLPERTGAAEKHKDQLVPLYQRLINAIREVDKKHMFTLEGYDWSNNWSVFGQPLDDNIFYQFHYYCWNNPDNLNDISYFLDKQKQLNKPMWVGETGERNNTIYFATTQYFEKYNIGWSFWPWKKMDTKNTPYSIKPPEGWKDITAYSRSGELVASRNPEKIFNDLLENIKLENCEFFPDVVNSMLRNIPLKLEAENFGHDGYLISYLINDTLFRADEYRKKEPVRIQLTEIDKKTKYSSHFISLDAGEWTAYKCKSPERINYRVSLRIKALEPAKVVLWINGQSNEVEVNQKEWAEIKLNSQSFRKDENEFKFEVIKGRVNLDWINIQ